jgi:hypothetical protein
MSANPKPRRRAPGAGRPALYGETLQVCQVRLTRRQLETAKRLGRGNASAGVREALERAEEDKG